MESVPQVRSLPYMARSQTTLPPVALTTVETSYSVTIFTQVEAAAGSGLDDHIL